MHPLEDASPGSGAVGPYRLLVFAGDQVVAHPLPASGRVTLGRSRGNDVRIDDASVSRNHAVLHLDGSIRIEDLGGANGTRVRRPGAASTAACTEELSPASRRTLDVAVGDCILLGGVAVVVR